MVTITCRSLEQLFCNKPFTKLLSVLQNTLTRASHLVEFLHLVGVNSSRKQAFHHGVRQSSTPLHTQLSAVQKSSSHFDMTPAHPIHPHSQYHRPPLSTSHSIRGGIAEAPVSRYHQSGSSSGLGTSRWKCLILLILISDTECDTILAVLAMQSTVSCLFSDISDLKLIWVRTSIFKLVRFGCWTKVQNSYSPTKIS